MRVDKPLARQWLSNVSYYRLSAYSYPARVFGTDGQRTDMFQKGTSFSDVTGLYEADRKLRTLFHDAIERIEVSLRTRLIEVLSSHGPLAYREATTFRPSFDHEKWIKTVDSRIERARPSNDAIKHYAEKYGNQYPFWVAAEVLDFSDISQAFRGLYSIQQRQVSESLGFIFALEHLGKSQSLKAKKNSPLTTWFHQLTVLRNTCAHHSRLWNRSYVPATTTALRTMQKFRQLPEEQSERIFGALVVSAHILEVVSPHTSWPMKVEKLLGDDFLSNPLVEPAAMGIPDDWDGKLALLPGCQ